MVEKGATEEVKREFTALKTMKDKKAFLIQLGDNG